MLEPPGTLNFYFSSAIPCQSAGLSGAAFGFFGAGIGAALGARVRITYNALLVARHRQGGVGGNRVAPGINTGNTLKRESLTGATRLYH
jgi:hypothetical protein